MKIGVVGLGLIGGSIFKNLRDKYDVVGVSSSVTECNVSKDYNILKDCNVVFVCSPMNAACEVLRKLEEYLSENTIVTDVCSLKSFVSCRKYKYKFIPSHPMAGTEHSGWDNSYPELFKDAKWVLTPVNGVLPEYAEVLIEIIKSMGAEIIIASPEEHDKAAALISHLPMVIAQALCLNIADNNLAQTIAASGFRDTTRLALSNVEMANDMVIMNKENILTALENLKLRLEELLQNDDYAVMAEKIKEFRKNLYSN